MQETPITFKCPNNGSIITYVYQHSIKHRDGNSGKSQWKISIDDEARSFEAACNGNWIDAGCGWGLHIVNGKVNYLGKDRELGDVFLAKFDNHTKSLWHGYPCDYRIDNQRPVSNILKSWVASGYLKNAHMRKITKGQRCVI